MKPSTRPHELHPALDVVPTSGTRPTVTVPRPFTLRAGSQRAAAQVWAAQLWRDAHSDPGDLARTALWLGLGHSVVSRYGSGDRALPLADVLAAPPLVAAPILRRALDRVEATPLRGEGSVVMEAVKAAAGALEVAGRLEACPLEAMAPDERRTLGSWLREIAARLLRLADRVDGGER